MHKHTSKAKALLEKEHCSLVFSNGENIIKIHENGIGHILRLIEKEACLKDYCCAVDSVDKSTAFLLAKLKVREVYCNLILSGGKQILAKSGISVYYHTLSDKATNEKSSETDCIEMAVTKITGLEEGFEAVRTAFRAYN